MKRKIKVTVWERADIPEKNKVYRYKKHERVLREINENDKKFYYKDKPIPEKF